ncbi:MAG: domain S-box protein [Bacteroidetes bacterium]|nr:domain S-box protein [Bacteroidota bacterium]
MRKVMPAKGNKKVPSAKGAKSGGFPVVAIGASSGGLEAVTELLKYLPANTGMAYIFIQHLSPNYKSILVSLLSKATKMKVQEIEDMELMKPDNVYVIPNNKGIEVTNGHIRLLPRATKGTAISIDVLFTSLAQTHHENTIGIILSGNASDGTIGLRAIKSAGGVTFAQDESARYGSMPTSAIDEGSPDFILSPRGIAQELTRISRDTSQKGGAFVPGHENEINDNDADLKKVLEILHKGAGVDFSYYKMNTVKRRILRRMLLHKVKTLAQYRKLLETQSEEKDLLYQDLLIHVTEFFRDGEEFQYLKSTLLPRLLKNKAPNEKLRIWITACSTGQEAYSMAMIFIELLGDKAAGQQVQIFASDLGGHAIRKARAGEYTKYEMKGVSAKRMAQFFTQVNGNYKISKSARDLCAFAPHNIMGDPPFSHIDLISCRNMLIYLNTAVHKKILTTFHYALNPGGCLMLGKSETIGTSTLFSTLSANHKIYNRIEGIRTLPDLVSRHSRLTGNKKQEQPILKPAAFDPEAADTAIKSILFSRYIPAYVVINHAMEIVQFKGVTSDYLEHATGRATLNVLTMARPEVAFDLREGIHRAIQTRKDVHKTGIEMKTDTVPHTVSLDIIPMEAAVPEPLLLIIFTRQEVAASYDIKPGKMTKADTGSIKKLKAELAAMRAEVIAVREEKEKANKILQAVNEEIMSSNEEFQSLNEELDTSKEEIESANEELITNNQELQTRNEELMEAYDFSEAIVATLHEPILILDKDLRVRSTNKAFCKKFMVQEADTNGKLLYELGNNQRDIPRLRELLNSLIQKKNYFYDYEITHVFPDIGLKTMLLNARRIVKKVQNEQLILLAFTDTTDASFSRQAEKKELEDIISERTRALASSVTTLKEKNAMLEKMNKELETFTFISSHDLQEPLRKIQNFAECLLDEERKNVSPSGKMYLERMQVSVSRIQQLIKDLIDYTHVRHDDRKLEKTDLNKLAAEVVAEFKDVLKDKKATIKVMGLCSAHIIGFQFRQLLHNLIGNSIKFADPKRPLRITINCQTLKGSKMHNEKLLPGVLYCHVTVTDNGIGFDPKYKERIFEVFQRLHEYDAYKGTGMGLAISKRIAENHNGIITATGTLNKGAQFDIYTPQPTAPLANT